MKRYKYNSWPAGKLPKKFQRPELENLSKLGIKFSDPRDVVDIFEKRIAKYCNSKYAVLTDCASHAIFLTLKYLNKISLALDSFFPAKISAVTCLVNNSNNIPVFLNLLCLIFI